MSSTPDWQEKLKNFFKNTQLPQGSKVYLFGSRARGDNSDTADIDLGFYEVEDFNIYELEEKIDSLNIPYKIDLVNLDKTSKEFLIKAKQEGTVIFEKRPQ